MERKRMKGIWCFGVFFLSLIAASMVHAAVLNVPGSYATIQSAIDAAGAGDTVQVAAGTYYENITLKNGVTVQGSGAETCTIQGNGTSSVVIANGITQPAALYGFTITGGTGYAVPWSENRIMGGGIFVDQSVLTIGNNSISANSAQFGGGIAVLNSQFSIIGNSVLSNTANTSGPGGLNTGGGIYVYDSTGKMDQNTISYNLVSSGTSAPGGGIGLVFSKAVGEIIINKNVINANTASGAQHYGGGIYCYQSSNTLTNSIRITGNTIADNQGLDGGGIAVIQCAPMISDNIISRNSAHWGGGIYGFSGAGTILNNTFDTNNAITVRPGVNTGGGGILCDEDYSPTIRGNTFSSNTAVDYGGGLEIYLTTAVIQENSFTANVAQFGGAIVVQDAGGQIERNYIQGNQASTQSGGGLYISNTTLFSLKNNLIVGNSAAMYGGGFITYNNGQPECINNTVVGNTAGILGGGIHSVSSVYQVMNNIITDNSNYGIAAETSTLSGSYNDVYGNNQGQYYGMTAGTGAISSLPQFSSTTTYRLATGSPCVNAGNPDAAYNDPDGSRNDMGAYGGPLAGYLPAPGNPLSAPVLTLAVDGNQVSLSWTASSQADGYTLYYAPPDISYIGSIDMGTKTAISASLASGTCFYVALKAYGGTGDSGYSNIEYFCIP